jgi:endopeptidase Clp ATP-binding regulatory subunit ClpX
LNEDRSSFRFDDRMREFITDPPLPDADEYGAPPPSKSREASIEDIRFDMKPEELIAYLRSYIVEQDTAIETVATKICTHFHRMSYERRRPELPRIVGHVKSNIMLIGPTGVGKTYLIKLIAHKLQVPFVKGDATKFSETGYVGGDVEDLVRELVHQSNGDIKLAEYGIIYIDEIDKIASSGSFYGPDVSRSGVQRNLLKLMEETEVDMKVPHDLASQMEAVIETQRTGKAVRKKVNTRNILFVMSGAFGGLPEIISRRLKKGGMGFTGEAMTGDADTSFLLSKLHSSDLVQYGFESEFVGRIPVMTYLEELTEEGMFGVLKNPNSAVVMGKKRDFAAYGIELSFDDDALRLIAKEAHRQGTGARALVSVVERVLLPYERSLSSLSVRRLKVTEQMVIDPDGELFKLLPRVVVQSFTESFLVRSGVQLSFTPESELKVRDDAAKTGLPMTRWLELTLKDYEFGLKLVGKDQIEVTPELLGDPAGYLDKLVKKSYREKRKKGEA